MEIIQLENFDGTSQQIDTRRFILIYSPPRALVEFIQEAEAGGKLPLVKTFLQYVRALEFMRAYGYHYKLSESRIILVEYNPRFPTLAFPDIWLSN